MSSAGLIAWSPGYCIGNPEIDGQHRTLFDTANALISGKLDPGPGYLLLHAQIRTHFGNEERVMRGLGYPQIFEHARQHDHLIGHLMSVRNDIVGRNWHGAQLATFFNVWLVQHIAHHDIAFEEYFCRASPADARN